MSKSKRKPASTKPAFENQPDALFGRVVSILEQARGNVVRAVNTQMVLAYWLIGREIVQELQGGKARANYGERVVEDLSARLTERFGKGFSTRNVKLFKQFYLTWRKTSPIGHPLVAGFRTAKRLAQGRDNGLPIFLANCRAERQERVG